MTSEEQRQVKGQQLNGSPHSTRHAGRISRKRKRGDPTRRVRGHSSLITYDC